MFLARMLHVVEANKVEHAVRQSIHRVIFKDWIFIHNKQLKFMKAKMQTEEN